MGEDNIEKELMSNALKINSLQEQYKYLKEGIDELNINAKVESEARRRDYEMVMQKLDEKFAAMGKLFVTKTEVRVYQVVLGLIGTTIVIILVTRFAENLLK